MSSTTPITRRSALRTGALATLAGGLLGAAGTVEAIPLPLAPIDRAEALMHDLERILVDLDEYARIDVLVELDRLEDIAKALHPHALAAELPRNTGANRSSVVMPWGDDDE